MDGRLIGGRYRLLDAHAIGGMASVWRAVDETSGETVAVKRLHPHLLDDGVARERLIREAAALQALHHPNVIGIRALVADPSDPALVMEFVPGRTAAETLATDGPLPARDALAVGASVADALAAAHDRGIVHRDVKPANVLLGDDGRVRLADFGIADDGEDGAALTAADGVVGTLRYLAPERLAGSVATPASDIWSLGALLVELASGEIVTGATTVADRVAAAAAPIERPAGVPDPVWAVAARALAVTPTDRYATSAEMADELHAAAGTSPDADDASGIDPWAATVVVPIVQASERMHEPVPATADRVGGRGRGPDARRPLAVTAAAALALIIAVGAMGAVGSNGPTAFDVPTATSSADPGAAATPAPTAALNAAPEQADQDDDDGNQAKDKGKGKGRGKDKGD